MNAKIQELQKQIYDLTLKLHELREKVTGDPVPDYEFSTQIGPTSLKKLFGDKQKLLVIHNMGQGCRYCTLWADGFNGFLPHLESVVSVEACELKDGRIFRTNSSVFGPGDRFCSAWNLLALAGIGEARWTPQYRYWQRPDKLDDGGQNLVD